MGEFVRLYKEEYAPDQTQVRQAISRLVRAATVHDGNDNRPRPSPDL